MNISGSNRYSLNDLREKVNDALLNKDMPDRLYKSMNGTSKIIEAIINTRGDNWASHVIDSEGKEILTPDEQEQFTRAFQPYLDSIINFFNDTIKHDKIVGGEIPNPETLIGLPKDVIDKRIQNITTSPISKDHIEGPDEIYKQIIDKFSSINTTVNNFASKYGVLRLEKEHDVEPDVRIVPSFAKDIIALGAESAAKAIGIPYSVGEPTKDMLDRIKIPFRLIISLIYLFLDVTRIVVIINGSNFGRKILSVTLSLLEFLRGDWKKAILSFIGYYGMTPLLIGQVLKAIISLFRMTSPQLQESVIYGVYDSSKSLFIGILLAIFKITAPEEIRLPLIGVLETIAQKKQELDTSLESVGLMSRPDYLAPSFEDLNNIQAVINDPAFICSKEFQTLSSTVNNSGLLGIILQLVGIPTDTFTKERKCGNEIDKPYVNILVNESKEEQPIVPNTGSSDLEKTITGGRRKIRRRVKTFA